MKNPAKINTGMQQIGPMNVEASTEGAAAPKIVDLIEIRDKPFSS